jgi:hypothetical protein
MSFGSDIGEDDQDREPERQAVLMEDKLHKDVASWSRERRGQLNKNAAQLSERAAEPKRPVVKQPSPPFVGRSKGPVASKRAIKPAAPRSKPFSMSYDGMTEAQYIQYRLDRGSR